MTMNAEQMARHLLSWGYGLINVKTDSWFADVMVATGIRPFQLEASFDEVRLALAEIEAEAKRASGWKSLEEHV